MSETGSILVAVDFSPSSRRAFELAAALCGRAGIGLDLLHVWNPNLLAGSGALHPKLASWVAEHREQLGERLEEWAGEARKDDLEVESRVVEGVASRVIPSVAEASGAQLVVVGRRGTARLAHVLLGSVSERVVHLSPCPVLVVPEATASVAAPERLLIGIDFSSASKDALHAVLGLARTLAPRVLVLTHVRPDPDPYQSDLGGASQHPDRGALERWARLPAESELPIEFLTLDGAAPEQLLAAARSEGCDWLVVGLQGQTALAAFLMGSTTDRVIKLSDRPTLVVPSLSAALAEPTG